MDQTTETRLLALEKDVKRHQAVMESIVADRFEDLSKLYAHLELIVEIATRLGCPSDRLMESFEDWRKHYHQRLLESQEAEHPALVTRMDRRPPGEAGGADEPVRLFPE